MPITSEISTNTEFIDCIKSFEKLEEDILKAEKIMEIRRAVAKLPADELELVIIVYYNGASLKTYAEKKDMSYLNAVRKKNKILEKLSYYIKI